MAEPKVEVYGKDLYKLGLVTKLPLVKEKKTYRRDLLIANSYDIPVINTSDLFSIGNEKSFLNGITWLYGDIEIYGTNEEKLWEGVVIDIPRNHVNKTAILKTKSKMYQLRKRKIAYTSSGWETAATSFKNICDQEGFTNYNSQSVTTSENRLDSAECYIKCQIDLEDNINFMEIIQKLGDYSNSDVYSHGYEVYFQHWISFTGGVSIYLDTESRILRKKFKSVPIVSANSNILINDYSIGYDGDLGIPATDSNSNDIGLVSRNRYGTQSLPETKSDANAQIIFKDKTSAIYLGESNIKRTHKNYDTNPMPPEKINFSLYADHKDYIDLNTFLKLTFPDEGWTEKTFELFEFNLSEETDDIKCVCYEAI